MLNVDIVIPVLNEQEALPVCIAKLQNYISNNIDQECSIIIADNGSNDATPQVSKNLVSEYENIQYIRIPERGRGLALKTVWSKSDIFDDFKHPLVVVSIPGGSKHPLVVVSIPWW